MTVYIVTEEHANAGPSKIGITRGACKWRLGGLQGGNHRRLIVQFTFDFGERAACAEVEGRIKRILKPCRCDGGSEWFKINPVSMCDLVYSVAGDLGQEARLTYERPTLPSCQIRAAQAVVAAGCGLSDVALALGVDRSTLFRALASQ